MKSILLLLTVMLLVFGFSHEIKAQHVGIGTTVPERLLEIEGAGSQYARIRTTSGFVGEAGIEFVRGTAASGSRDWSIVNDGGVLKFLASSDNFGTRYEVLRVSSAGLVGIGTNVPNSTLHIDGGEEASAMGDGYAILGSKSLHNLVIDPNEVVARYDGGGSTLFLQPQGGDLYLQQAGGISFMTDASGYVSVNAQINPAKFNVRDAGFQMHLRNPEGTDNDWYIGASEPGWVIGDDQLVFSPSTGSGNAILRLRNTPDNTGTLAPVRIVSSASQALLIDGNEIDSEFGPLYINHNSDNNT